MQRTTNLSSAEDKTSSTALASQGSSNSAPEEVPVDSRQEHVPEHGKEHNSSAPPVAEPSQVGLKAEASPEKPPEDPGDDAGIPLKTKPLPGGNAIAQEVPIRVTGAKAGSASEERDLFSELTSTVLVFEKGGVIRLTAAVTPGQLLFLSNEESKREVVTQVIRKRAHRPTECYIELEFTEPAPGFWGTEFSAASALLPRDAKLIAAAEMISSSETTEDESDEAAPPPSAEEVEALKREVEALRRQVNVLQTQTEPAQAEPAGTIPSPPPVSSPDTLASQPLKAEAPSYQSEKAPWTELSADVTPVEGEPKPAREHSLDQRLKDLLPKPAQPALDFRVPVPKRGRSFRARGQFTPGFRSGMLRLVILSMVLAALIGFVWYKRWLPGMHQPTKFSVSTFAAGVTTKMATGTSAAAPISSTEATKTSTGASEPLSAKGPTSATGSSSETSAVAAAGNEKERAPYEVVAKPATPERSKLAASIANAKPSAVHPLPTKMATPVQGAAGNSNITPPKLIKSQRAVATLEDLHDFETGSVVIDAIVDTDGNVTSPTVLSGPPSLRKPALDAVKYYRYQPATQNGRPVLAHVTVKIQFHFE
ncbi:MAG TPA: energy transducer TonB [Candidatus Acidoferrum sp.]|nr:energy transducer TonB [Candidatus Acidoferrum sp.]